VDEQLGELAAGLRGYVVVDQGTARLQYHPQDPEEASFVGRATRYLQLYDLATGRLLLQSRALEREHLVLGARELAAHAAGGFDDVVAGGSVLRLHDVWLQDAHGRAYLLRVGLSLDAAAAVLNHFLAMLLVAVPAGVGASALGGWLMARLALRPIERVRAAAEDIGISRLDRRLPLRGTGDEIDRLAAAFNATFDRLSEAVARMRHFAAAISHELRTPLLVLRGEAEVALRHGASAGECREVLASQLEEFERLTRLINQFLTLALADAGEIPLDRRSVDLGALVRRLVADLEPLAEQRGLRLSAETRDELRVCGDDQWLERLVLNLLDNALRYTLAGGSVRAAVFRDGPRAALEVADTGIGIPADALPHVFERFYRAGRPGRREGAGIGLALVRWIADAHGGTVAVASQAGVGSRFRVTLPLGPCPPGDREAAAAG